jgi:hypothetical protein
VSTYYKFCLRTGVVFPLFDDSLTSLELGFKVLPDRSFFMLMMPLDLRFILDFILLYCYSFFLGLELPDPTLFNSLL